MSIWAMVIPTVRREPRLPAQESKHRNGAYTKTVNSGHGTTASVMNFTQ